MLSEQLQNEQSDTGTALLTLDDILAEMSRVVDEIFDICSRSNEDVERCLNGQGWTGKAKLLFSNIGFALLRDRHPWHCDYNIRDTNERRRLLELRQRIHELTEIGIEKVRADRLGE